MVVQLSDRMAYEMVKWNHGCHTENGQSGTDCSSQAGAGRTGAQGRRLAGSSYSSEDQIVLRPVRRTPRMYKKRGVWVFDSGVPLPAWDCGENCPRGSRRTGQPQSGQAAVRLFFDTSVLVAAPPWCSMCTTLPVWPLMSRRKGRGPFAPRTAWPRSMPPSHAFREISVQSRAAEPFLWKKPPSASPPLRLAGGRIPPHSRRRQRPESGRWHHRRRPAGALCAESEGGHNSQLERGTFSATGAGSRQASSHPDKQPPGLTNPASSDAAHSRSRHRTEAHGGGGQDRAEQNSEEGI